MHIKKKLILSVLHFSKLQFLRMFVSANEPTDVLNTKRGVLSALQLDFNVIKKASINELKEVNW